jgi:radical SAM protein with 4Fe4S-binding SPASM domain
MSDAFRLAIDDPAGPAVFIDGDLGEWAVGTAAPAFQTREPGCPTARSGRGGAALSEIWLYTNTDCNLTCRHCFVNDRSSRPSFEDLMARADGAMALGAATVYITGGEPLLRDDIAELIAAIAARARVCVLTNGTLVTPGFIAALDRLGASEWKRRLTFQVSIDGPRSAHDAQRGSGTFERALRGVGVLADWGRPPTLATALTALTAVHAHEVTALAAGLGCGTHHLFLPHRSGRLECVDALVPAPMELLAAVRRCRDVAEASGVVLANDEAIANRIRKPGRRFVWCNGGSGMAAIGADGTVYPCPSLVGEAAFAEPGDRGLAEALAGPGMTRFRCASVEQRPACAKCEYRYFCGGGCGAHAFRSGGALDSPEPYCEVYRGIVEDHLRRESRRLLAGLEAPLDALRWTRPASPDRAGERTVYGCT